MFKSRGTPAKTIGGQWELEECHSYSKGQNALLVGFAKWCWPQKYGGTCKREIN